MTAKKLITGALKYLVGPLVLLCIVVVCSLLAYRAHLQHTVYEKTHIDSPHGIDSVEKVNIGGIDQGILIRGEDTSNPVLLFLHGGPGGGDIAIGRYFDQELARHFVVVHWDQRGAGKSYSADIPVETMNIEQFIADVRDVTELLRKRFDTPKIYLVGHSWGSALGALTAARYPKLFRAFVGVGQLVEDEELEEISYQFTLDQATKTGNQQALQELKVVGPPPYANTDKLLVQRKWLEKFGGFNHMDIGNLWIMGATSPDCSLTDALRYARGQQFSLQNMWETFSAIDLFETTPRIEVPVYFFLGRHDYNTPPVIAERYYQLLDAPLGKQIVWFENCGHMIPFEEPDKFCEALVEIVLKETRDSTVRVPETSPAQQPHTTD